MAERSTAAKRPTWSVKPTGAAWCDMAGCWSVARTPSASRHRKQLCEWIVRKSGAFPSVGEWTTGNHASRSANSPRLYSVVPRGIVPHAMPEDEVNASNWLANCAKGPRERQLVDTARPHHMLSLRFGQIDGVYVETV